MKEGSGSLSWNASGLTCPPILWAALWSSRHGGVTELSGSEGGGWGRSKQQVVKEEEILH